MNLEAPEKLEIFLLLALRQEARFSVSGAAENTSAGNSFAAVAEQIPPSEAKKFERLRSNYENKSEPEKNEWREKIESLIGADAPVLDENIHRAHIDRALQKEIPAIRRLIESWLAPPARIEPEPIEIAAEFQPNEWLVKRVRRAFSRQFVTLGDLPVATDFDRLNGAQFARLVRLAGVGEVALACLRIPAVESVGAFLRRFPPEDARAIAARLKNLSPVSSERLAFAENLVHAAFETEPDPAAMLDYLGIRLVGASLCAAPQRLVYTQQKLPPEASRKFAEIVETECRRTPPETQREIGAEIEALAQTIAKTTVKA